MSRSEVLVRAGKAVAARLNLDVHRRDLAHPARRTAAMGSAHVDCVLDVGANTGQYATALREHGYTGRIESFEAIPELVAQLTSRASTDEAWRVHPHALGRDDGLLSFNVSEDTVTSSPLVANDRLLDQIPSASTARTIDVPCRSLASIWEHLVAPASTVMLKLDVQGFEHAVLDGLGPEIEHVTVIEVEMGLVGLYEGGSSIHDLLPRLHDEGFGVVSIDSGYVDIRTGQVLDIDVLMARRATVSE